MPYKTGQDISDPSPHSRIDVITLKARTSAIRRTIRCKTPGARPEVWAFGFRNPWRMSFDRSTGELWVGDVGWEQWEMVYRVQRGGNYGWSITEGLNLHVRTDLKQGPGPILPPLVAVPHSEGASITGGHVYHGRQLPQLRGAYLYGDWETGKFWALRHDGDKLVSNVELCDTRSNRFVCSRPRRRIAHPRLQRRHLRFVPNTAPPANQSFPQKLSETGLFSSLNPLAPAPGTSLTESSTDVERSRHRRMAARRAWHGVIVTEGGVGNIAGQRGFPEQYRAGAHAHARNGAGKSNTRRRIETQLLHWDGQA
jgi:hypothetical protein